MPISGETFASVDETARRRFESAWRNGRTPVIEDHIPPIDDARYLSTLEELIHIDLEMVWKANGRNGTALKVEDYLLRFPILKDHSVLVRLIEQEIRVRQKYGEPPSAAELTFRFPGMVEAKEISVPVREEGPLVVPGYDSIEPLGRGGMGVVYKARQIRLDRPVALKMLRYGDAQAEELSRFRTEAESAARLQHANIVQVYEVGEVNGRPYLAMEFVPGQGLDKFLANGLPTAELAARVIARLARAIHYAHRAGVIHRDLKPANILLADSSDDSSTGLPWSPKIADFGLAKRIDDDSKQTQTGAILGTPSYMAPEQAAGRKDIGPGADIYALGVILYEMLTGQPPFRAASSWDTICQVINEDPTPPSRWHSNVPRDIETICLKCLEKEPAQRYASAGALAEDLERFIAGRPVAARPIG